MSFDDIVKRCLKRISAEMNDSIIKTVWNLPERKECKR